MSGGRPPLPVVSPFQRLGFRGIQVALRDLDGDGILESLVFPAHRGRHKFSRIVPV